MDEWRDLPPNIIFHLNDSVEIINSEHKGSFGAIISLLALKPEVTFLVELSSGGDVTLRQSDVKLISF
jgi:transcription elongation factor